MGVKLSDIVQGENIQLSDLSGKVLCVDAFNMLYQFITTIRGPDGSPLTDSSGNITSHLVGLFGRMSKLMQEGIKLVFVFDGKAPELKREERERRNKLKARAQEKYDEAVDSEDAEQMAKYAGRFARLTPEMIEEAKKLLEALGIPVVQAPSEGEAQASYMVAKGDAYGIISQDYDCLLFGVPRMIKNLSVGGRKRKPGTFATTQIEPEMIVLDDVLNKLELSLDQLRYLGLLIGTDFNVGGIKGLGPKKGLKLVREYSDAEGLFSAAAWSEHFSFDWKEVFELFSNMPVTDDYSLVWRGVDADALHSLLVEEHDFSENRVKTVVERLSKSGQDRAQKGLGEFF